MSTRLKTLHAMSDALMKYETIDSGQLARLMRGEPPGEPGSWSDSGKPATGAAPPARPAAGIPGHGGVPKPAAQP